MMNRIFALVLVLVFTASPFQVSAVGPLKNLVITYDLPASRRQACFKDIVQNNIPKKSNPDHYHVTLGWAMVDAADFAHLKSHLNGIAKSYLSKSTFTPDAAKRYLVNRTKDNCGIVLHPKATEANKFKAINLVLYNALLQYNRTNHTNYKFISDVEPKNYVPHITLVNTSHINNNKLNRDHLLNLLNAKIKSAPQFDLLHVAPQKAPLMKPVAKAPAKRVAKKAPVKKAFSKARFKKQVAKAPLKKAAKAPIKKKPVKKVGSIKRKTKRKF